jgi:hypothetical protein
MIVVQAVITAISLSGNEIHAGGLSLCRFDFLSGFDAMLIGRNRCSVCVGRLVCDEPDFRLTNDDMGRVCGTYATHVPSLLEFLCVAGIRSCFLKRFG